MINLKPEIFSVFGTADLGDGRNIKNIEKFLKATRVRYKKIIIPKQVHGDNIEIVGGKSYVGEADGLITCESGVVLTVITADCIPAVFADKKAGLIGIAHLGRLGSEKGLAAKMIENFTNLGSKRENITVALGPGIGACCYETNLVELNFNELLKAGIRRENIDFFPFCTKCDEKRFFSYRRARREDFPRQFNLVVIN